MGGVQAGQRCVDLAFLVEAIGIIDTVKGVSG